MRRRLSLILSSCSSVLFSYPQVAEAAPSIALPVNAQVPPVARVGQKFQFQFSESTFTSAALSLEYSLDGAPSWLQVDSLKRTLIGSPSQEDVGAAVMQLVASDNVGSTAMPVTLFVTEVPGPERNLSSSFFLQTTGTVTNHDTIIYHPALPISVSFPLDTFTKTNSNTEYYATCANNTPLPSWLTFDESNISFSGLPPPSSSPYELPQMYPIRLLATNVPGFYTAETTFVLTIATHKFYFENIDYKIRATPGEHVSYEGLQNKLMFDDQPIAASNLRAVAAITPTWLSFDKATLTFTGTAPLNLRDGAVAVFAEDVYGGTANTTVSVTSGLKPDLIDKDIGPLQATIGRSFTYQIPPDSFSRRDVITTIDIGDASSWLKYDNTTLVLSGKVPTDLEPQTLQLIMKATYDEDSQQQTLTLNLIDGAATKQPSITSHAAVPTPAVPTMAVPTTLAPPSYNLTNDPMRLAAAIIIPIIVVLALLLAIFCLRKRRKRVANKITSKWDWIPCVGLWRRCQQHKLQKRAKTPPNMRYSTMDRGPTPQMGLGFAPQIEDTALTFKHPPESPKKGLRPLADIGQTSRPGSFVRQLASNRWSYQHPLERDDGYSKTEYSIAEEPLSSSQTDSEKPFKTGSVEYAASHPSHLTRTVPKGQYGGIIGPRPMRSLRQSYTLGPPQDDRPGRRSIHGFGHGRPFPEHEIPPTLREESAALSGVWTDTTASSHGAMNSNSSGGSSNGYPPRSHFSRSPPPQTVRQVQPTIRQVGSPHPASERAQRETATSGSASLPRPPSFQSYLEARCDVVRKLREKDSTSFSGYRTGRKSSSGKETIEEDAPAVPVRLRPALEPGEAVRVSRFYSSHSRTNSAQRKGSLIHDRFRQQYTESPVTYDLDTPATPRHEWPPLLEDVDPYPVFTRRRSKSSTYSGNHLEPQLTIDNPDSGDSEGASAVRRAEGEIAPLKLNKRRSWTGGDKDTFQEEEEEEEHDEGMKEDEGDDPEASDSREESPPPEEVTATRIIIPKRRPLMERPRNVYGSFSSASGLNLGARQDSWRTDDNGTPAADPRDASFRFL